MEDIGHEVIHFSGRVQGVGFRYQTLQTSREFDVAGYVCNLPDGRVRVEVEGRPAAIEEFLQTLQERMHGYIRKTERVAARRQPQFQGFSIR